MTDRELDDILKRAAGAKPTVDTALLDRISRSLGTDMRPVEALPASWILTGGLVLVASSVGLAGAMLLGPHGVQKMNAAEIAAIFSLLGILIWLAARLCVAEMIPGSPRPASPGILAAGGCIGLAVVFGLLFHDYRTERFVSQGLACLTAGLVNAAPAALGTWWLLRRGFAVDSGAAGFAAGLLAGLAGITMLELHCPNFEAPHVIVWHIAVLPISGVLGMLAARKLRV